MEHDGIRLFGEYLRENELTFTDERKDVLRAVYALHNHFSADELCEFLSRQNKPVSRASVYRTLNLLSDAGLVRSVNFGRGAACYEHVHGDDHHDHMVCVECGKITEFCNGELEAIKTRVCSEVQFVPLQHSLKIFGYCHMCCGRGKGEEEL